MFKLLKLLDRSGTASQWDLAKACLITLTIIFTLEYFLYKPSFLLLGEAVFISLWLVVVIVLLHPWISGHNVTPLWGVFFSETARRNRAKLSR